jgi:hypothetical protein
MIKYFFLATAVLTSMFSIGQTIVPCKTDEVFLESVKQFPELIKAREEATQVSLSFKPNLQKKATVRIIPVVFHVIHKNGLENISQTQINDAIRILNEDFRKKAGTNGGTSTDPLATDFSYEFRLAQFNPNGQPSNGVNRIYNLATDNAGNSQKALSYWDARKYLNVWVVSNIANDDPSSMILGYAQFPFQLNSQTSTDGIMCRADQYGIIEMANVSQAGRTVTHEVGHWVGLYHPFQGGCAGGTANTCQTQGDQVCDTPPVASATNGCPSSRNSCTNETTDKNDLVRNYMDYANGNCMDMFTAGQKARADGQMATFRSNIYGATNLSAIGINTDGSYKTLTASTVKAPYFFNFSNPISGSGWRLENYMSPGDSGWQYNNSFAAVGGQAGCMAQLNLKNWRTNVRNAFTTPDIDISSLSAPTVTFQLAYAKRTTASGDRLRVFISNSYGREEILIRTITANDMQTGAVSTNSFQPTTSEWKKFTIDLSAYKSYTNCKIRFELQSLRGNNIYFDEFAITEPTSMEEALKSELKFNLFPNPAKTNCTIDFELERTTKLNLQLRDLQGREVQSKIELNLGAGKHAQQINLSNLRTGLYLLEVQTEKGSFVHKLWVE